MATFLTHYLQNKDKLWDYYELCGNPQVNVDIIKEFPYVYDFTLSDNINLSWNYIINKKNKINWNWNRISSNPCITWDIIQNNPHEMWDYTGISENKNLEDILELHNRDFLTLENKICMFYMSCNSNVNFDIIQEYNNLNWDPYCVSFNPNVTWDIVIDNPQYPWDINGLALNPNITWDIVEQYPNGPHDKKNHNNPFWDYKFLSRNKRMK